MLKKLLPCLKGYGWYAILSMISVTAEVVLEIYIPFIMSDLIDKGIALAQAGDISYIVEKGLMMIVFALLSLLCGVVCARASAVASTGFAKGIRNALFNKIEAFSFSNIDKFSTASLVTRLTNDVTNTQQAFVMCIRMLVRSPMMLVGAIIMAVRINKSLSVVFLFAVPVLAASLTYIAISAFPRFSRMLKHYDEMNGGVQENLIAIRVVKAFVRSRHEKQKFSDRATLVRDTQIAAERIVILNNPISTLVMYATMVAVCAIGGLQIIGGYMEAGQLMSFMSYINQILIALMMISMVFVSLVLTKASINRICEVLDERIDLTDDNGDSSLSVSDGSIEFDNVSFSYSKNKDNLTLHDINVKIKSGETIGIVGGTGSAKTTLVQLIPRLYDVYGGSIKVGGHDVRNYKLKTLRDSVAMVLQKNVLFTGTIKENLRWGKLDATDAEIEAACKSAHAHDFITAFPGGYDTDLGQGGVNVSGGQKQRLCIARALLKKPKIIVLDDSTSAVDTATDAGIRAALKTELSGTTTLIIAQRIASVKDADRIIVMNEGAIDDIGTHDELLSRNEIYKEVYYSQSKEAE